MNAVNVAAGADSSSILASDQTRWMGISCATPPTTTTIVNGLDPSFVGAEAASTP
jgi:hypothetical protein